MVKLIHRNPGFTCLNCGHQVKPLAKSCRNHCNQCLYSLHVDLDKPGDRQNPCQGLMKPEKLEQNRKKGYIIVSRCVRCKTVQRNFAAPDDNLENLIILSQSQLPKKPPHGPPGKNRR